MLLLWNEEQLLLKSVLFFISSAIFQNYVLMVKQEYACDHVLSCKYICDTVYGLVMKRRTIVA